MPASTRLHAWYNIDRQYFCDSDGTPLAIEQLPRITLEQQAVLALTCIRDDGTAATFEPTDSFSWAADDDWDSASELLLLTATGDINAPGLWADADPAAGTLAIPIDAASASLQSALGSNEEIALHGELKVYAQGADKPYYIGQMELRARNLVDHAGVVPPAIGVNHYSRSEVDALLTGYPSLNGDGDIDLDSTAKLLNVLGITLADATELTVASGAITPTRAIHTVDTEADAATDDLATIDTWTGLLVLRLANSARVVSLTHGTGANQIETSDGNSLELTRGLTLLYRKTTSEAWAVLSGGAAISALNDIANVNAGSPSDGQALVWDSATSKWIADTIAGGAGSGGSPVADNYIKDETLGSAATNVDLTSLDLTPGNVYQLEMHLEDASASANAISLYVNTDYTATNYYSRTVAAAGGASPANAQENSAQVSVINASQSSTIIAQIAIDSAGRVVIQSHTTYYVLTGPTVYMEWRSVVHNDATTTSITALRIASDQTNGIATGSRIRLYKLRDVTGAGGEMTSIAQTTLAAAATDIEVTGLDIVAGERYRLVIMGLTDATASVGIMTWDDGAGTYHTTNYEWSRESGYVTGQSRVEILPVNSASETFGIEALLSYHPVADNLEVYAVGGNESDAIKHSWGRNSNTNSPSKVTKIKVSRASGNFAIGTTLSLYREYTP